MTTGAGAAGESVGELAVSVVSEASPAVGAKAGEVPDMVVWAMAPDTEWDMAPVTEWDMAAPATERESARSHMYHSPLEEERHRAQESSVSFVRI